MTEVSKHTLKSEELENAARSPNISRQADNKGCSYSGKEGEPPLGMALFRVSRAMFFESKPIPELNALPMAQLRLLWAVRFSPDATMKDLSERLSVSQSTVTQLADRLVRRNFVVRNTDQQDRRVIRLRLSEAGREIVHKADTERRAMTEATWNKLSQQEQQIVMQGLEFLGRAAEAARTAQGRPLSPLPDQPSNSGDCAAREESTSQNHPVVDLMSVRVRGR